MNVQVLLHSLEHAHDGLLDGRNLHAELAARLHQLARVQLVVRATRRQDLCLFLQRVVLVGERGVVVIWVVVIHHILPSCTVIPGKGGDYSWVA